MRYKAMMAVAAIGLAAPALAEEWDFILVNDSGKEIKTIELSPAGAATWVANKVEEGSTAKAVRPGGRTTVHFEKGDKCGYDIKATFDDDTSGVWSNINVCNNAYVTLRYRNGAPVFAAN